MDKAKIILIWLMFSLMLGCTTEEEDEYNTSIAGSGSGGTAENVEEDNELDKPDDSNDDGDDGSTPGGDDGDGVDPSTLGEFSKRIIDEVFSINDQFGFIADTFTSSDENIATVNNNGEVTVHAPGFVEITAEDSSIVAMPKLFNFAFADVATIDIFAKDAQFNFKAWVGESNTVLNFNDSLFGLTFVRSSNQTCEPILLTECDGLESDIINQSAITDTVTTLDTPGFYHFTFGENTAATSMLTAEKFEVRSGEATIVFNNKLFLIGGYTSGDVQNPRVYKSDIWVSDDGDEWLEIAESASFPARSGHQLVIKDNKLWLLGGSAGNVIYNDVWVTEDGITWTQVNQLTPFSIRTAFEAFNLNGELFVAGGYTTHGAHVFDMWRSPDGISWSKVTGFALDEPNNAPFIITGEPGSQTALLLADKVYNSTDGLTWTVINETPIFGDFDNREAAIINGDIWLFTYTFEYFGSRGSKNITRMYKSSDQGVSWSNLASKAGGTWIGNLIAREAKPIAFKDRAFIVGGRAEILEYTNEVWSTTDGELWIEHALGGFYGPRYGHGMTSHNGKLYSTGGTVSDNISVLSAYAGDLWSSEDGLDWTLVKAEHALLRPKTGLTLVSTGDMLCTMGGYGRKAWGTASGYRDGYTVQNPDPAGSVNHVILFETYGAFADIACSADDGENWSEVVPTEGDTISGRIGSASVYFQDKLWVIGGNLNASHYADVWSTNITADWDFRDVGTFGAYFVEGTEHTSTAAFGGRTGHALTIHNNEMYLSAGRNSNGFYLDDLWKSSDGINWQLVNSDMGDMDKRAFHQMVSFDDKLFIIAGRANYHETLVDERTTVYEANDIWVSEDDGLTWSEVTANANFEQRQEFQAVVHEDAIYVTGGTGGDGYVTVQGKDSILNDVWRSEDGTNWRAGIFKDMTLKK